MNYLVTLDMGSWSEEITFSDYDKAVEFAVNAENTDGVLMVNLELI